MVTSVRPIPTSYYYSGQGRLGIGDRDPVTGELSGAVFVGNVTTLAIDIAPTKFDHKESMSGGRNIDLTLMTEKKGSFKFTSESLELDLLADGLYGSTSHTTGSTATAEVHFAQRGKTFGLDNQNITSITTIATVTASTALVAGTDYDIDLGFGTVYVSAASTVVDIDGEDVVLTYVFGAYDRLEAFTVNAPPERYLRFEGLNTVNGDLRLIEIYRGAFDPLTGLEFINVDLGSGAFAGSILQDPTVTTGGLSQFFRERRILAA